MNKNLPKAKPTIVFSANSKKQNKSFSPSIYRFITEEWKIMLTSFISGLILIVIMFQSVNLYQNMKEQQRLKLEREKLSKELIYWKNTAGKYKSYRDVYFKIAAIEYKLGNTQESKNYIKKALELDPNFKEAKVLGVQVGL